MTKKTEQDINAIVGSEESMAIDYHTHLSKKRETLINYYHSRLFGDELEGQSQVVTSDVSDTVEGMLPSFLRLFTQSYNVARFISDSPEYDEEAEDKTNYANHVFWRMNNGVLILHNMMKDALLQYCGVVKVYWDETDKVTKEEYEGLSEFEYQKLKLDQETTIDEEEQIDGFYDVKATKTTLDGRERIDNIPPEEFLIAKNARDFEAPRFIGQRTPKTRSDLLEMGFNQTVVEDLPKDGVNITGETAARYDEEYQGNDNPGLDPANDIIYLGEYYLYIDVDGDGIAELYQVFRAGETILDYEPVDSHPFCAITPIPVPHKAIGTCPAEQAADIQKINSTLLRQYLTNIYNNNYPRTYGNDRVVLDDLLTPRSGGHVRIDGEGDISGSLSLIPVQPMGGEILQGLEYMNSLREVRTGITRYNQGLDADSLNQTATGFKGIMDASQQRMDLIARIFADTGIKDIFRKIIELASKHQKNVVPIKVLGKPFEVDPTAWRYNLNCYVDVGMGSGDRQEKIVNLNNVLNQQMQFKDTGSVLADDSKIYQTLNKLITETGLKDVSTYFNNPDQPEELLQRENELLKVQVAMAQMNQQNPLAEAEMVKVQGQMAQSQQKIDNDNKQFILKLQQQQEQFFAKMADDQKKRQDDLAAKLTELELKYKEDVPGALV